MQREQIAGTKSGISKVEQGEPRSFFYAEHNGVELLWVDPSSKMPGQFSSLARINSLMEKKGRDPFPSQAGFCWGLATGDATSVRFGIEGQRNLSNTTLTSAIRSLKSTVGLAAFQVADGGLPLAAAQPLPSAAPEDKKESAIRAARARLTALQSELTSLKGRFDRAEGAERGAILRAVAETARGLHALKADMEASNG